MIKYLLIVTLSAAMALLLVFADHEIMVLKQRVASLEAAAR